MPKPIVKRKTSATYPCVVCGCAIPPERVKLALARGKTPKFCGPAHRETEKSRVWRAAKGIQGNAEQQHRARAERRAKGLCIYGCGNPGVPGKPGGKPTICLEHRTRQNALRGYAPPSPQGGKVGESP